MFLHHRVFILSPKLHLETRPDTGCSIDDVTLPEFEFFFCYTKNTNKYIGFTESLTVSRDFQPSVLIELIYE